MRSYRHPSIRMRRAIAAATGGAFVCFTNPAIAASNATPWEWPLALVGGIAAGALVGAWVARRRDAFTHIEGEKLADKAIDFSADAFMITTAEGRIVRVNPAFTRVTGYTADEVIGRSPALLRSGRHDAAFYTAMWETVRRTGSWEGDIWNRHKDGHVFAERLSISAMRHGSARPSHYVAVFSDVTEARQHEARMTRLAHFDSLTGLPNRALMQDRLDQAVHHAHRARHALALLFLDLDRFKSINDTLGHAVGDDLLKAVATRLTTCVRESDSVGRHAGDEFVILLPDLEDGRQAGHVARKILQALEQPLQLESHSLEISASIGIALFPDDAMDTATLLAHADAALYEAKSAGRGTYRYFTTAMNVESARRAQIEKQLRNALANDELRLRYQPLKRVADGRTVAMEALCEWRNPTLGTLPAAQFASIAESSGMSAALDRWILDTACHDAARWPRHGGAMVRVAVNLATQHVRQGGVMQAVLDSLAASGLPADHLELELSEALLVGPPAKVVDTLAQLKSMGVRLVVDGFGARHSALAHLHRSGIDRVKIDRCIVSDVVTSQENAAIVGAIIDMGRNLRIEVLADGVDSDAQHAHLAAAGCHLVQGALPGAAMRAMEVARYLSDTAASRAA